MSKACLEMEHKKVRVRERGVMLIEFSSNVFTAAA
jgi:hypothetical protein